MRTSTLERRRGRQQVAREPLNDHCTVVLEDIRDLREPTLSAALPADHEARVRAWRNIRAGHPAVAASGRRWRRYPVLDTLSLRSRHLPEYASGSNMRSSRRPGLGNPGTVRLDAVRAEGAMGG